MKKYILLILLAIIGFLGGCSNVSNAASFDCDKAQTKVEKSICSNIELSHLDEDLSVLYNKAKKISPVKLDVRKKQRDWIKLRNNCKDENCIKNMYVNRILELKSAVAYQKDKPLNFCSKVVTLVSNNKILQYKIPSDDIPHLSKYKNIDLDSDGLPDDVLISSGSMESFLSVKLSSNKNIEHDDGLMMLFKMDNKIYILVTYRDSSRSSNKAVSHRVYTLERNGVNPICDAWQEKNK